MSSIHHGHLLTAEKLLRWKISLHYIQISRFLRAYIVKKYIYIRQSEEVQSIILIYLLLLSMSYNGPIIPGADTDAKPQVSNHYIRWHFLHQVIYRENVLYFIF